jgi:hypothetical protein
VIAGMVVVRREGGDLAFEIAGQEVVLKQDAVLERLPPAAFPARISVSSSLLAATMIQKSSLLENLTLSQRH